MEATWNKPVTYESYYELDAMPDRKETTLERAAF